MKARCTLTSFIQFDSGTVRLPSFPASSVLPRNRSCIVTPLVRA
jgi:hypothetical protein